VAASLARTLLALRLSGTTPAQLDALAGRGEAAPDDARRLGALAGLYRRFHDAVEGRFADTATLLAAARDHVRDARWLEDAELLIVDELELTPLERDFVEALARVLPLRLLAAARPPGLHGRSLAAWAVARRLPVVAPEESPLAALAGPPPPAGLARLRESLFEPPTGEAVRDGSVELLTAPGEAAEVRSVVRRLLREAARGVPFEEMAVVLGRPDTYAPLFTELLERLGVPHRLHPSLPLRFGRAARSLLLLLRCRGLGRAEVMEFLTFAEIPFEAMLGEGRAAPPARWDALSREAGIVSGLERWLIGLRQQAELESEAAAREPDAERRERRLQRAADAESLLRVVELLSATLDSLAGEAGWPEWSRRLGEAFDQWIVGGRERAAVAEVVALLAGLGSVAPRAAWRQVEQVLEARFDWERLPLEPLAGGGVHIGALDAIAGLPFRVVALAGLVEGGFPGVLRPDPFLLDAEREALGGIPPAGAGAAAATPRSRARSRSGQLSLFDAEPPEEEPLAADPPHAADAGARRPPTTQDRLLQARLRFHRAVSQASERLILAYPRADARTGRERLPSLFFVAAASALHGRPLGAAELEPLVAEDALDALPLEQAVDRCERDRVRVRRGGEEAVLAVAAGSSFFRQSHLASRTRWSNDFTPYDGLVAFGGREAIPPEAVEQVRRRLDPVAGGWPISASKLATYSRCGFQYLLQHVLRLEPALEPEERKRLEPLERGSLFHEVAELFLRERRDRGELPVRSSPEMRRRALELADERLEALVAGSPPRFALLWDRERERFRSAVLLWLEREAREAARATPAHFEVSFGPMSERAAGEPHSPEPLAIALGDGRELRVSGKIDRIDRLPDGTLVLRDYKTGKAPRDDGGVFRGGKQLQIPFYILAAEKLFPGQRVVEAFLDYVDGGRQVALDPRSVQGEEFRALLRDLVNAIAQGLFLQEPSSCDFCDYKVVCGPKPLLELRRRYKVNDRRVQQVLRLRNVG
jgi:RecB family exonuclease